jgi:hypothetical protein
VSEEPQAELLGTTRRVVVVLGLVIDGLGKVLYGEVVDPQAEGKYRFVGPQGIGGAVSDWLRSGARDATDVSPAVTPERAAGRGALD